MPVGAYGGRREIMSGIAPVGPVYQAGTLSGNPVAMAAGLAQLRLLKENDQLYQRLNRSGDRFFGEMDQILTKAGIPHRLNHIGSLGCIFFNDGSPVEDYESAQRSDTSRFTHFFRAMLQKGIYLAPSQFEAMFLSSAHTETDLEQTLDAVREYVG